MSKSKKRNSYHPRREADAAIQNKVGAAVGGSNTALTEEQAAAAAARFEALVLPAPVLDEDGYEVIPASGSTLEGGTYRFKHNGQAYELPNMQYLPVGIAMQLAQLSESQALHLILNRYAPGLVDDLDGNQLMHISKRWRDHSKGVALGE